MDQPHIDLGRGETPQRLALGLANRHGLIAGATGTGKTVSLQVLAEGFSAAGVPVFLADVKGDLSGLARPGEAKGFLTRRAAEVGVDHLPFRGCPTLFWDLLGERGHPVRATISEMGPLLLSRLLGLNDTQEGVLNVVFRVADEEGLLLLDLKDLRALLGFVGEHAQELTLRYGNVSPASVGAIQRRLLTLENQGAERFFGEPALEIADLMRTAPDGRGYVNILVADRLVQTPALYATFLLWLIAELFEELPEVGDPEKPRLVFFFDEAHLLFRTATPVVLERIVQVARLIRSKGVGVYFVTQSPADIPDEVLGQLGNRIQHALRAFTPRDLKAVRVAAETFRPNPRFDAARVIGELAVGEALVSTLQPGGIPGVVERTLIRPPLSRLGPLTQEERRAAMAASPLVGRYDTPVDRESAYEILEERARRATRTVEEPAAPDPVPAPAPAPGPWGAPGGGWGLPGGNGAPEPAPRRRRSGSADRGGAGSGGGATSARRTGGGGGNRQGLGETLAKSVLRTVGDQMGKAIVRTLLGSLFKGR